MTTYSTVSRLPLPDNTDALVAERAFGDYASAIDSMMVPQYASTTARDAAMLSGKVEGQVCTVAGELQWWDGTAWWGTQDSRYVTKAADTSRTSTSTLSNDPHLTFSVKAGGLYVVNAYLSVVSPVTTVNFQGAWAGTAGVGFVNKSIIAAIPGSTNVNQTNVIVPASLATTANVSGTPSTTTNNRIEMLLISATSDGTVNYQWAPNAVSASAVTLQQRSYIEYRRVS